MKRRALRLRAACAVRLLPSLLLMLPAVVQAQFSYGSLLYSTSNETVTIIGYQGVGNPGGNLIIPDTIEGLPVTTIGYAAIRHTSLASITIPPSVTSIGDIALDWNLGLTSVYFEGNAPSIGADVFDFDPVTVYYLPGTLGWGSTFGGVPAVVNPACQFDCTTNNGTVTITGYSGSGGAVTIPGEINNLPVTGIGMRAFEGCDLTSVTMGNSVTNIDPSAFVFCFSLTAITVDALNLWFSSVDGVLFDKTQTTLIAYPAGKPGGYAIPNSVTSIGGQAFYGCDGLTSIIIPNSVTKLGGEAFCDCTSLTSVTIGSSVTSIGGSAFSLCTSLTTVYFRGNAPSCDTLVFGWYTPPSGLHPNPSPGPCDHLLFARHYRLEHQLCLSSDYAMGCTCSAWQFWLLQQSIRVQHHRKQQPCRRHRGEHESSQSYLVSAPNQHPHRQHALFHRPPADELSRSFLSRYLAARLRSGD